MTEVEFRFTPQNLNAVVAYLWDVPTVQERAERTLQAKARSSELELAKRGASSLEELSQLIREAAVEAFETEFGVQTGRGPLDPDHLSKAKGMFAHFAIPGFGGLGAVFELRYAIPNADPVIVQRVRLHPSSQIQAVDVRLYVHIKQSDRQQTTDES